MEYKGVAQYHDDWEIMDQFLRHIHIELPLLHSAHFRTAAREKNSTKYQMSQTSCIFLS